MNKPSTNTQNKQDATSSPATLLRNLWLGSCARYTVLCLILLPVSLVTSLASDTTNAAYIDPARFLLLLPPVSGAGSVDLERSPRTIKVIFF